MAKTYARDFTLLRIAKEEGWGFVQTNQYGESGKSHLLQMRANPYKWVKRANWDDPQVIRSGITAKYSDKLAYYYCISFKGFIRLMEAFPQSEDLKRMKINLFEKIFNAIDKDKEFINFRL